MLREKPLVPLIHDALGDKNGTFSSIHKPWLLSRAFWCTSNTSLAVFIDVPSEFIVCGQ
jgi:hypothetical protein